MSRQPTRSSRRILGLSASPGEVEPRTRGTRLGPVEGEEAEGSPEAGTLAGRSRVQKTLAERDPGAGTSSQRSLEARILAVQSGEQHRSTQTDSTVAEKKKESAESKGSKKKCGFFDKFVREKNRDSGFKEGSGTSGRHHSDLLEVIRQATEEEGTKQKNQTKLPG